jgi:hypothetical protein
MPVKEEDWSIVLLLESIPYEALFSLLIYLKNSLTLTSTTTI